MEAGLDQNLLKKLCDKEGVARFTSVAVALPRFKIESRLLLDKTLTAMGMADAFGTKADFSGMNGKRGLALGRLVHGAVVEVNEKGVWLQRRHLPNPSVESPKSRYIFGPTIRFNS